MEKIYLACIVIGIVIPLFSLVADFIDGFCDLLSFDFLDIDIGDDLQVSLLPLSINSICAGLLFFGGTGWLLNYSTNLTLLIVNIIAGVIGYLIAIIIQTMIKKLKRIENTTLSEEQLLLNKAKVINKIPEDGLGAISIELPNSSSVSYPAKSREGISIPQETVVEIIEINNGIAIVQSEKWLEDKYER